MNQSTTAKTNQTIKKTKSQRATLLKRYNPTENEEIKNRQ